MKLEKQFDYYPLGGPGGHCTSGATSTLQHLAFTMGWTYSLTRPLSSRQYQSSREHDLDIGIHTALHHWGTKTA